MNNVTTTYKGLTYIYSTSNTVTSQEHRQKYHE
jgi:hypothetical protein